VTGGNPERSLAPGFTIVPSPLRSDDSIPVACEFGAATGASATAVATTMGLVSSLLITCRFATELVSNRMNLE
jgi:hypothetical protein